MRFSAAGEVADASLQLDAIGADVDMPSFLAGESTPVFVGSALTNFGVRKLLDAVIDLAAAAAAPDDGGGQSAIPCHGDFQNRVFRHATPRGRSGIVPCADALDAPAQASCVALLRWRHWGQVLAIIALSAVLSGEFNRRGEWGRMAAVSGVAIVFEDTFLFNDTVAANIAFARPDASHDDIERAARLAGAHDFVIALPDAYDTKVGERGFSLSGGQRQRLALARAILEG